MVGSSPGTSAVGSSVTGSSVVGSSTTGSVVGSSTTGSMVGSSTTGSWTVSSQTAVSGKADSSEPAGTHSWASIVSGLSDELPRPSQDGDSPGQNTVPLTDG